MELTKIYRTGTDIEDISKDVAILKLSINDFLKIREFLDYGMRMAKWNGYPLEEGDEEVIERLNEANEKAEIRWE